LIRSISAFGVVKRLALDCCYALIEAMAVEATARKPVCSTFDGRTMGSA
jgi:hypothetical protein